MNGWPLVALGELGQWTSGGTPKRSVTHYFGGSIPWAATPDLTGSYVRDTREHLTESGINSSAAKIYPVGTILISMYGSIGKLAITAAPMASSQALAAFYPNPKMIDTRFALHALSWNQPRLEKMGKGGTQKNISQTVLKSFEIPVPPLDEQQRIATILDSAKDIRKQVNRKFDELNEMERSSYLFFFGESTLSTKVEELAEHRKNSIRTGPFGSQLRQNEFTDSGITVLGLDNVISNEFKPGKSRYISPSKFQELKRYEVFPGDVLISIMGTTGRCAIVPEGIPKSINTKHICAISPDHNQILPDFMRATFLWHPKVRAALRRQTKGAIMAGLNMTIIKNLEFPVPPMSDQLRWAEQSKSVTTARSFVQAQRVAAEDLYTSLATRAFAGEL